MIGLGVSMVTGLLPVVGGLALVACVAVLLRCRKQEAALYHGRDPNPVLSSRCC